MLFLAIDLHTQPINTFWLKPMHLKSEQTSSKRYKNTKYTANMQAIRKENFREGEKTVLEFQI